MLFNVHELWVDVCEYIEIVDRDFLFRFECPPCISMKSLGCSFMIYPHKLNSAVLASTKVVSCVVTVKTVSIVWLFLSISLIAVLSYRTSYWSNWQLSWATTDQKVCPFSESRHSPRLPSQHWPKESTSCDVVRSIDFVIFKGDFDSGLHDHIIPSPVWVAVLSARAASIHCSRSCEVDVASYCTVRCGSGNDRTASQG
jgi:hypothetical protein